MYYSMKYNSPIGELTIVSDEENIVGLWIKGQKYFLNSIPNTIIQKSNKLILQKAGFWLDRYFKGENPSIKDLSLNPNGSEFRQIVWKMLCEIPYGKTSTYGEIAKKVAKFLNKNKMSAQAIGGAIGHNPISIIIPCHRVVGTNGSLTGYAGGIEIKKKLLEHEKVYMSNLYIPK